jgi:putrescine aminotransferase
MDGTTQLIETDRRYLVHPLHHPDDHRQPLVIVEGKGAMLRDADGREYIDSLSGLWNVNVGHGRGELADAAAAQMRRVAFASAYIGQTNEPAVRLSEKIVGHAYANSSAVYFTTAGAESNESAFKFARYYWKIKDKPAKTKIISRIHAYHGVTMAAMSATGMAAYHKMFGPLVPGFIQVTPPYAYRWPGNEDPGIGAAEAVEKAILAEGPDTVAAVIAEPVMGAGGVIVPPPSYFPALREICDERLSALGRRHCLETRARGDRERPGRPQIHARRHLFRPSGMLRSRPAQRRDHRERGAGRARRGHWQAAAGGC